MTKPCVTCGTPSSFAAEKGNGMCRNCWAPDYLAFMHEVVTARTTEES